MQIFTRFRELCYLFVAKQTPSRTFVHSQTSQIICFSFIDSFCMQIMSKFWCARCEEDFAHHARHSKQPSPGASHAKARSPRNFNNKRFIHCLSPWEISGHTKGEQQQSADCAIFIFACIITTINYGSPVRVCFRSRRASLSNNSGTVSMYFYYASVSYTSN